jgi:eukaryotic-like serine/threonine-protein kinase
MGIVYKGEQTTPIRRTVALKVIKLGMDTAAVVARFEAERQALAVMNHPNVAKVFDAGATDTGRPYFVMEYVDGEPITRFCDRENYTTRQRLELFKQACDAVQHAHQKAIIHRDLKPSNILVAVQDGKPVVKVIDFGVAKAIEQKLTERTLFTEAGLFLGTPEYMSPEQAEAGALDIDTRTDIYSLGVVLYELLSGTLPFDPQALRSAGYAEIQRIIREVDAPRPSTRLSSLGEGGLEIAVKRQIQIDDLTKLLRSELEWIPLKALRKDRAERYETATQFAQDIDNYLNQRPLLAGPESAAYRLRKFARRNKLPLAAAVAMALVLLGGIAATTWQAVRATRAERRVRAEQQLTAAEKQRAETERDSAQATLDFLTNDVLAGATPERLPDPAVRDAIVKAMIEPAAIGVTAKFQHQPQVEARIHSVLATTYQALGRADIGLSHAEKSVEILRREMGDTHPNTLTAVHNAAGLLHQCGKSDEAERLLRDTLMKRKRILGDQHAETLQAMNTLGVVLKARGNIREAEDLYRAALISQRHLLGARHASTLLSMNNLATLLLETNRAAEAEMVLVEAESASVVVRGADHPETLRVRQNLAASLRMQGRFNEAEPVYRDVLAVRRRILGNDHPDTVRSINNLAALLRVQRRAAEAEPLLQESLQTRRKTLGDDHPETLSSLNNLGIVLLDQSRVAEAEPLFAELQARTRHAQIPPKVAAMYSARYGPVLIKLGKFAEAEPLLLDAYRGLVKTGQHTDPWLREVLVGLVKYYDHVGRAEESKKWQAELASWEASTRPSSAPASQPTTRLTR